MDSSGNQTSQKSYFFRRNYFSTEGRYWSGIILLESVLVLVGNTVALRIFLRRKFLASRTSLLLINLTAADLFVGLWKTASLIFTLAVPPPYSRGSAAELVKLYIPIVSLSALAVVSVERAFAVLKPFLHRVAEEKYYYGAILASWLVAALPWVVRVEDFKRRTNQKARKAITYTLIVLLLLVIIASFLSIYLKVRFYPSIGNQGSRKQHQVKLSKTLFLTTVVSLITWCPFAFIRCVICNKSCHETVSTNVYMGFRALQISNSFLNILVYSLRMHDFKKELKKTFCTLCVRFAPSVRTRVRPIQGTQLNTATSKLKSQDPKNKRTTIL